MRNIASTCPNRKSFCIQIEKDNNQCVHLFPRSCNKVPGGSEVKASDCNGGDPGSIPGSGRSPGEGNGNLLQYSCLDSCMDRGAWRATVHGSHKKVRHDLAKLNNDIPSSICLSQLLYPFVYCWALRLFLYLGYYE